jgi:hypothetical protein
VCRQSHCHRVPAQQPACVDCLTVTMSGSGRVAFRSCLGRLGTSRKPNLSGEDAPNISEKA